MKQNRTRTLLMRKTNRLPAPDVQFGHDMLPFFPIAQDYIMTNSGAHGVTPNYVIEAKNAYYRKLEENPDQLYRFDHAQLIQERMEIVAKELNAPNGDVVIVENATEAINSVLKSIKYQEGETILIFDIAYRMVEEVCVYLVERYKLNLVIMPTTEEILNSKEKIVGLVEDYIQKLSSKIKVAIIDHISSTPAVVLPLQDILKLFKKNSILCIVDGAHALGQIDVDIRELDPDVYVANCHKWAFGAKSASALYVKKDYTPVYSLKEGFEFIERLGRQNIKSYNHELALKVGNEVSRIWGTKQLISDESAIGAMVSILLPYQEADVTEKLGRGFAEKYNTYIKVFKYNGKFYARFCCQIFNEIEDYVYVADAVKQTLIAENIE